MDIIDSDPNNKTFDFGNAMIEANESYRSIWNQSINDEIEYCEYEEFMNYLNLMTRSKPFKNINFDKFKHFCRKSGKYRYFQLDCIYKGLDYLVDYLNQKFKNRSFLKLESPSRIYLSKLNNTCDKYYSTLYYLLPNKIENLNENDVIYLLNECKIGLNQVSVYFQNIQKIDKSNVVQVIDTLLESFKWIHLMDWLNLIITDLYVINQIKTIDSLYFNRFLEIYETNIDSISRSKILDIYSTIEMIYRSEDLLLFIINNDCVEIEKYLIYKHPHIYQIIDSWSMKYKSTSEDFDHLLDTAEYIIDIKNRILNNNSTTLDFLVSSIKQNFNDLRQVSSVDLRIRNYKLYLTLCNYIRITQNKNQIDFESEINLIIENIIKTNYNQNEIKLMLNDSPRLLRMLTMSYNEFILRDNGHHIIVQIQRKMARMMKNAGFLVNRDYTDCVFDISVCEFIGMFWESHLLSDKSNHRNKLVQNGQFSDGIKMLEHQKLETTVELVIDDYNNDISIIKLLII